MAKDNFWNDGTTTQRRHKSVSTTMTAAAQREDTARSEVKAEAQKCQLEEAAKKPQEALSKSCGEMSFNPCEP